MIDHAEADNRREDRIPVDLGQPMLLKVHNPLGDVTVRATDRGDVLISHVTPGLPGVPGGAALIIDAHDNRIEVRLDPRYEAGWDFASGEIDLEAVVGQIANAFRRGGLFAPGKPGKGRFASGGQAWCEIAIDVPRAMTGQIEIHTASGDVRIEDVASDVALKTASGDLRVLRVSGNLALKSASGDLAIEGARGRLSAQTASGDVRVLSSQIEGFDVQTASGDLHLDALLRGDGHCRAQTASGDVRLTLRRPTVGGEEPAATLAFQTVSGDAHVTSPFRKTGRRLWRAGADDGGPRIEVTTVSGDLSAGIAAADDAFGLAPSPATARDFAPATPAAPVPPTPPAPPPAPAAVWPRDEPNLVEVDASAEGAESTSHGEAERLAVLEAVERGEIDVEEALRRLEAADVIPSS